VEERNGIIGRGKGIHWVKEFAPMTITAVIHEAEEGGFWAEVPGLPGCMTQGDTLEEVKVALEEAVAGWLEASGDMAREKAAEDGTRGTHPRARLLELAI
jgi:predicted RNase H-like HicB family nuclease